jgi:hypothetical protein
MKCKIPLDGRSQAQRIEEAKKLLMDNGYVIRGPLIKKTGVRTPNDLVRFFYDTLTKTKPDLKLGYGGNINRERAIAKRFIDSRVATGTSKQRAIIECCDLIELLFKYEYTIGLEQPVLSMSVLGQDSMYWVTEKLVCLYEKLNVLVVKEEDQKWLDKTIKLQECTVNEDILLRKQTELDRILLSYGKEKEGPSR